VSFFQNGRKVFESEPLQNSQFAAERLRTIPLEFQLALENIEPGAYTCQITVMDEHGRKFAFRRTPLVVLPAS
jgi:hypothetical protein